MHITIRKPSWPREKVGPVVDVVRLGITSPNTASATITLR